MRIDEVGSVIEDYFRNTLKKGKDKVIKVSRTDKGWEARVEVIEENELVRSLGKYPPVYDRNLYDVKLNDKGEILSYEQAEKQFVSE